MRLCLIACVCMLLPVGVSAQDTPNPPSAPGEAVQPDPTLASSNSFGPGYGALFGFSDNLSAPLVPVDGVHIDAGDVVITKEMDARPRILVESHYTFRCFHRLVGCGPAFYVQMAGGVSTDLFNAAGGGLVLELGDGPTRFAILLGVILDFGVNRLRPEYIHGFPSPTPELRFLEKKELHAFVGFGFTR